MLTAFHCLDYIQQNGTLEQNEIQVLNTMNFRFQYKSPSCSPSQDGTNYITVNGATLRASWHPTDFVLVELNSIPSTFLVPDQPRSVVYAGWSRTTASAPSGVGIHHPNGDVMKISREDNAVTSNATDIIVSGLTYAANRLWMINYDAGTIEGGSSGSPFFNSDGRVVGQLLGARNGDRCTFTDGLYGRFNLSWDGGGTSATRLRDWLDPSNSGAMTLDGMQAPATITSQFFINGPSTVPCNQTSYFGNLFGPNVPYVWTVSSNLQIVSGQGTNFVGISANTTTGGTGTISARIGCASSPRVLTLTVSIPSCARMGVPTELNESDLAIHQLRVYPNPAKYEFHVKFISDEPEDTILEVFDITGKHVYNTSFTSNAGVNDQLVKLEAKPAGSYQIRVTSPQKIRSGKLVLDK